MSIYDIFILLGGVGLFLYGMTIMSSGLKNACGDNLKVILGKATKNKVTSILDLQLSNSLANTLVGFVKNSLLSENGETNSVANAAEFYELTESERFQYQLQQGICRINNPEIRRTIERILTAREKTKMITQATKLLKSKKNVILQGAPGTGKTYATAALALSVLGVTDVDFNDYAAVMRKYEELRGQKRIFFTTFHQSMDYEDFVEGIKPQVEDGQVGYSVEDGKPSAFPEFDYGMHFTDASCQRVKMGEWTWETGMTTDKTRQFERVRDYGMLVIYANWSYLKHHMPDSLGYRTRSLGWVAYMAGKRESRRLMGDYILKQDDVTHYVLHEDGTAAMSWPMDLHYPDPKNTQFFPGQEFKTINKNTNIHPYPIPYRCLYSRNVNNLFMAGRCISVSHVVHGSIRVMRTTGMMGEVVGMAASLCKRHGVLPRAIYRSYFPELKQLMEQGVGKPDAPDNQKYNEPYILPNPPELKEAGEKPHRVIKRSEKLKRRKAQAPKGVVQKRQQKKPTSVSC